MSKVSEKSISNTMDEYVSSGEMSGGVLCVRKNEELVYENKWGFTDVNKKILVNYNTIFRMASMSKVLTTVGLLKLYDKNKIGLDDELRKYIPEFANMQVVEDKRFEGLDNMQKYLFGGEVAPLDDVYTVPANREITIRDLLTHSSGLEMGLYGLLSRQNVCSMDDTLTTRSDKFSKIALDFQPGTKTGYSPTASFDVLARVIEKISDTPFDIYMKKEIFDPLEMSDAVYQLTEKQKERLIPLYKVSNGEQIDVTDTSEDINGIGCIGPNFMSGSAGVYCTARDYEHFTEMLCNNGVYKEIKILEPKTVRMMFTEKAYNHLEPEPGMEWALGVKVRKNPVEAGSFATIGTYGWSGAFGTHFFVSPNDRLGVTFVMNRSDIGGSGSYISKKVEELVFKIWAENEN